MAEPVVEREIVLRPGGSWLRLDVAALWAYRDLVYLMVRRDFVARFKQTILGPLWFIVAPLLTTVTFTVVFGRIAELPTDGLPQVLFYNAGLLLWGYFSGLVTSTAGTFSGNANLFGKVYFPRLIIPVATAFSALIGFVLQLATFFALYIAFKQGASAGTFGVSPWIALFPLLVVQAILAAFGVGFWICALTVRYRDLAQITGFLINLWMYATPVIYPASQVPERWRWLVDLNPATFLVEASRLMLLGRGSVDAGTLAISVAVTLVLFLTGLFAFNRAERTFIDTV